MTGDIISKPSFCGIILSELKDHLPSIFWRSRFEIPIKLASALFAFLDARRNSIFLAFLLKNLLAQTVLPSSHRVYAQRLGEGEEKERDCRLATDSYREVHQYKLHTTLSQAPLIGFHLSQRKGHKELSESLASRKLCLGALCLPFSLMCKKALQLIIHLQVFLRFNQQLGDLILSKSSDFYSPFSSCQGPEKFDRGKEGEQRKSFVTRHCLC